MKRALVLLVALLMLSLFGSVSAQEDPTASDDVAASTPTPGPQPTASGGSESAELESLRSQVAESVQDAERVADNFDRMMNILEVGGAFLGLFAIVAGFLGFTSLRDVQSRVESRVDEKVNALRAELTRDQLQREDQFDALSETLRTEMQSLDQKRQALDQQLQRIHELIGKSETDRAQAGAAIRALTLVQLAEQQMAELSWRAARRTLEEAYVLDRDNRAVNYYLGELFIMQRDLDSAESHLKKAQPHAENDVFPPALAALAYVYRLKGDRIYAEKKNQDKRDLLYSESERLFRRALAEDELVRDINGESVYGMLGALLRQWGREQAAIDAYKNAVRVTPHRSYPLNNLAMLYFSHGQVEDAIRFFDRSEKLAHQRIDNYPTDYWGYFDLINAQLACARQDLAEEELDRVLTTIEIPGPLESFLIGLSVLRNAPHPPENMDRFINKVERRLETIRSRGDATEIGLAVD
ncbi:MAG: hypothetical protein IPK19_15365 [Chloroflexi bacterium]|nr:hypothetical protein [Chloroflexota bacterium]